MPVRRRVKRAAFAPRRTPRRACVPRSGRCRSSTDRRCSDERARARAPGARSPRSCACPAGAPLSTRGHEAKAVFSITSGTLASFRERSRRHTQDLRVPVRGGSLRPRAARPLRQQREGDHAGRRLPHADRRAHADCSRATRAASSVSSARPTQVVRDAQRQALMTTIRDPVERVRALPVDARGSAGERRNERDPISITMTRQDVADYLNLPPGSRSGRPSTRSSRAANLVKRMTAAGAIAIVDREGLRTPLVPWHDYA